MKIVIIGGTGFIGSKVADNLRQLGHTVIAAAPSTGINTITGEGLAEALQETEVVVDISNSPSLEDSVAIDFFTNSSRNLLAAEKTAGVKHHLVLSIVGADLIDMGYMRAKKAQEDLTKESGVPYTVIRSTQFYEFVPVITGAAKQENEIHVSDISFQPIAAEDVAKLISTLSLTGPANGTVEIAGPERHTMSDFVGFFVKETGGSETVVTNHNSEYFGVRIPTYALVPQGDLKVGHIKFKEWISHQQIKS